MKKIICLLCLVAGCLHTIPAKAWGYKGHAIVAEVAINNLTPEAKKNVLAVLEGMSVDTAGNWMDIKRSDRDYNFMKPWHYIDFPQETKYTPNNDENIVNRILITYNELLHKKTLCNAQIKTDVLVLFHLIGDLGMPLHTAYEDDLGGNKRILEYDTLKSNLHKFWDEDLIRLNNITLQDCMNLYNNSKQGSIDTINKIQPVLWMTESRSLLGKVYDFEGYQVDAKYVQRAKPIITRQLLVSGLRLAQVLNKLFQQEAPTLDMEQVAKKFKNGIDAKDAKQYIGKKVTACGKVYGIKATDKVFFINVGADYPKSPLTVVIFEKDKTNFPFNIEEHYADKNICVKGELKDYKEKAEIIVSSPEDILIQ